jgi:signal transduction histidine kinase
MEKSAAILMQPQSVALKESVRLSFVPLLRALLLGMICLWGVPETSKEFAQQTQTRWFLLMCAAVLACIVWARYHWRGRQMMARLDLQFKERLSERARIAQDLHDTLLQGLLSASMQLHVVDEQLPADSTAKPRVRRVLALLAHVIDDSRDVIRGLRPSNRSSQDLKRAFLQSYEELAVQREVSKTGFRFIVGGVPRPLHPATHDEIYLIGREALINAVRHSRASEIEVEPEYAVKSLRVLIRDNGCGIDTQVLRSGRDGHWGLSGMCERAQRMGAKFRVLSRVGAGTEVELSVAGEIAFEFQPNDRTAGWLSGPYRGKKRNEKALCGSEQVR